MRAERKSPNLFSPSPSPIDAIAPQTAQFSVADADSTITGTGRPPLDASNVTRSSRAIDGTEGGETSSAAASSVSVSSSTTTNTATTTEKSTQRQSLVYSLQDENADLRKEIQSLEIVLRDHGFSKDGKQIVPNNEILRIDQDHDEDGNQRAHMEMVSMMGMDPERPTVLTKYMEFKINELEDDLEKMEYDRDRFAMMVKNLTAEETAKEIIKAERLQESKSQKRILEEKLTNAMKLSKTRESILSEKVGDLESDLDDSHRQKDVLRERISELEHQLDQQKQDVIAEKLFAQENQKLQEENQELTAIIETQAKKETLLKEQITALRTNLEWNIEEATKREELLRGQIAALETSLEWNIDNSSRREDYLRDKINELETSNKTDPNENDNDDNDDGENDYGRESDSNDDDDDHDDSNGVSISVTNTNEGSTLDDTNHTSRVEEDTLTLERLEETTRTEDDTLTLERTGENSLTQADLLTEFLKQPHTGGPSSADAFQQSISEISKYHNERLEQWKREESKEREEQLVAQIAALETNLEWNMQESKKQELLFEEKITALKTNLEWNIEESTKRETLLKERIEELETKREEDSVTTDSLIPPDDFLEMKKQLEKINIQKQKLEEWLSKVVEESTKREKNLQQLITQLDATAKLAIEREEILVTRVAELETQAEELEKEKTKQGNLQNMFESALEKEFKKQDRMRQEIVELQGTLQTNKDLHETQIDDLLSRVKDLTEALDDEMEKRKIASSVSSGQLSSTSADENDAEKETLSNRVEELEKQLESLEKIKSPDNSDLVDKLKAELDMAMRKTEGATARVFELENELASYRKEKFDRNKKMARLQGAMEEIAHKNEGLSETIMELESDLEYERQEKLDSDKRIAKLQGDLENLAIQQAPITAINEQLEQEAEDLRKNENVASRRVMDLENELESYRREKFDRNKRVARLQNDIEEIAQKNEGLSETVMELESDLEHERKEKFDRTKRIAELENELEHTIQSSPVNHLRKGHEEIGETQNPNSQRIFDLENELAQYRKEKFERNKKMARIQTDMEAIAQKNEGLLATIMELESDLDYEQREKSDRNIRIAELQSDLQNAKVDLDNTKIKQKPISSLNDHLEREAEANELERNSLINTLEKLRYDFDANKQSLKKLKKYNHDLEVELEALKLDRAKLKNRLQVLTEDGTHPSPKSPKSSKAKSLQSPESSIQVFLQNQLKTAKAEQERLLKCNENLTKELQKSNSNVEQELLVKSNEKLTRQLEEATSNSKLEEERLQKCIEDLTAKLEELQATSNSSIEQESLVKSNEDLAKQLEEATSNSKLEEERLHKCIEDLTAKLEECESNANMESERFNTRIKELTTELEQPLPKIPENGPEPERTEAKRQHQKSLKRLRNKMVAELKNELENRQRVTELAQLKEEFVETAILHKTKEEELSTRCQALETELEFCQHEHERMERVVRVLRNELKMAAVNHEPIVARNKELEKQMEEQKIENESIAKELDDLKKKPQNTSKTLHNQNLNPIVVRNAELEKQVEEQKTEKESIAKELDDLKKELQNTSKTLHNNNLDLKIKLKSKQSEFEHLNEFKHELEAELEENTKKVERIENEFETAAKIMDTTFEELSTRNTKMEKELVSYKSENQYLSKYVGELQNKLAEKEGVKREAPKSMQRMQELMPVDSVKKNSEVDGGDDSIQSEHVNVSPSDELVDSDKSNNDDDDDDEMEKSAKTYSDDIDSSSSSSSSLSSTTTQKRERKRLTSEISEIEKKLEVQKARRESLSKSIAGMEEEKSQIKQQNTTKSTSTLTVQIRESEAEIEVINAQIYELEADLEDLLDELWDFDRDREADIEEQEQDLDKRMGSVYYTPKNREHLSSRVVELEREMEELEGELEETIERSKSQRQTLVLQNEGLEKKLEAVTDKAMKEKQGFVFRMSALEKELEETIEKSRKDQQSLAIHYIEKERELKDTKRRADAEEKRLKSQISKLEKMMESYQDEAKNEEFLFSGLSILMEDVKTSNDAGDDSDSKESDENHDPNRMAHERLIAKVSELKEQFSTKVSENNVLNELVLEFETKLKSAEETVQRTEKEIEDLSTKYEKLEIKWKASDEDHSIAIWEAEQKMRDLIDTASLERKEKKRFQDEGKTLKKELETIKEENYKTTEQLKNNERNAREAEAEREILVQRNSELEKDMEAASTKHETEKKQIMNHMKTLKDQLYVSTQKIENLSAQIELHEAEREKHAKLTIRFGELEKELQTAMETAKKEKKLHMDLKKRLVEITMKHQAERANLDNKLHKLQKELKSTRKQNQSLVMELKFFEADNESFRKVPSYERGTSQDRTVTENTSCDEDTFPSDRDTSPDSSGELKKGEVEAQEESDSRGNDSTDNSNSTARFTNKGLASVPFLEELESRVGAMNPSNNSDKLQTKKIEDYLSPLLSKANKVLDQEIPATIVRGVHRIMVSRAREVTNGNFSWEDFEAILEEVCKDFDQDTWFDIQEAFFVAWEEIEIEKMAGDLADSIDDEHDGIYNQ